MYELRYPRKPSGSNELDLYLALVTIVAIVMLQEPSVKVNEQHEPVSVHSALSITSSGEPCPPRAIHGIPSFTLALPQDI